MAKENQRYRLLKLPGSDAFLRVVKSVRAGANAGGKVRHDWLASINPEKLN